MQEYKKNDEKKSTPVSAADSIIANREAREFERLKKHVYMSDIDKFRSFTRMLRRHATLKKAVITHHK